MLNPPFGSQHQISVVIADDHTLVREGLVTLISQTPDCIVVGEAADGRTAVDEVLKKEPDVVLMDIGMPNLNGMEAIRRIKRELPHARILVLSGYDNDEYVLQVVRAGASGYLLKSSRPEQLIDAIRAVHKGQAMFSAELSKHLPDSRGTMGVPTARSESVGPGHESPLTTREREILQLVAEGKSHQQISEILHISVRTVDTHRNNMMKKLNIHDTASLVTYAIKNGILILPR